MMSSNLKSDRAGFFQKSLVLWFWPKTRFFKFYEKLMLGTVPIFLHIVTTGYRLYIGFTDFLGENFALKFWTKIGLKLAQSEVFRVSWKINAWNFSVFLHEVTTAWRLEIESNDFFGKMFYWGFLGKRVQMSFLSFITNLCIEFFWFFAWSYNVKG